MFSFKLTTHKTLPDYVGMINAWIFLILNIAFFYVFAKLYWKYKIYPTLRGYKKKGVGILKSLKLINEK